LWYIDEHDEPNGPFSDQMNCGPGDHGRSGNTANGTRRIRSRLIRDCCKTRRQGAGETRRESPAALRRRFLLVSLSPPLLVLAKLWNRFRGGPNARFDAE